MWDQQIKLLALSQVKLISTKSEKGFSEAIKAN